MPRLKILSPLSGQVWPLERIPDPVFAQKMVGDGNEGCTPAPAPATTTMSPAAAPPLQRDAGQIHEAVLKSEGIAPIVKLDGQKTIHLLAGLNADQYAAEMRGQLAA